MLVKGLFLAEETLMIAVEQKCDGMKSVKSLIDQKSKLQLG